ncbi:MAG: hypothetical protein SGI91_03380 [Alphaproteobacteria bacterium]|nr:hypothetical protein [Alphaproteobacteria bacterium]
MTKLPVMATVSLAYGFLLGEIGTILRLVWAPLLVGALLSYLFGGPVDPSTAPKDAAAALQQQGPQFLIGMVSFVTGIMATVALLRVVVFGDRQPGLYVYLWLGGAELRLIAVTFLLIIAFIAAIIGASLLFAVVAVIVAAVPVLSIVLLAAMGALIFVSVWVPVRLSLVSAVVVAESNLGVERSWALSKGNAWRLFLVILSIYLPYLIAMWIAITVVLGADFPAFPAFPSIAPDAAKSEAAMKVAAEAFQTSWVEWEVAFLAALRAHWTGVAVLGFIGNVVTTALWTGAMGTAYRMLAGDRHA